MLHKIEDFFEHPLTSLVIGLLVYFSSCYVVYLCGGSFDPYSALAGSLATLGLSLYFPSMDSLFKGTYKKNRNVSE